MKNVILKSLSMRNFRGEFGRTTEFSPYGTTISGKNGSGKSRHFDAFLWLLFGKDVAERKDFEVKTKDASGKTMDKIDVQVSAVIDINGSTNELKRVLTENWTKPKGQEQEVFKGNVTEVFWNDVPLKVSEFDTRVAGIIDSSLFKMLTNPLYFPNMPWKAQREQLFQLAGNISDAEIATKKPEYAALIAKLTGKDIAGYKAEISQKRKKLKDELEKIQPRVDQTQKLMPPVKNWADLQASYDLTLQSLQGVDTALTDKLKANQSHFNEIKDLQLQKNNLDQQRISLANKAKIAQQEVEFSKGENRRKLEAQSKSLTAQITELNAQITVIETRNKGLFESLEEKRAEYPVEEGKQFDGSLNCSCCGQLLPEEKQSEAKGLFAEAKKKKLAKILEEGTSFKSLISENDAKILTFRTQIEELTAKDAEIQKAIALEPKNEALIQEIDTNEIEGYSDLSKQIEDLTFKIAELNKPKSEDEESNKLQVQKVELSQKLDTIKSELRDKDLIEKYTAEIESLHKQSKELGQQIANLEKDEFLIAAFSKERIEEMESRVNGLFSMVKFKLFDYTIDGNEFEVCEPQINGVPFGAANTASKILAGLDIIKSLQRFYNAYFPIFCDNAESVNQYPDMDNQMIYLKVTKEDRLTVSFANEFVNSI